MMRNKARTSIDASSTVSRSGSLGKRYGMSDETIGGIEPSVQNSGFRRFCCNFTTEFLLFFRVELLNVVPAVFELLPALLVLPLLEPSSTGR